MSHEDRVRGGLRRRDCQKDVMLNNITAFAAGNSYWRVASIVLKNIPLKTGVLLTRKHLKLQMEEGLKPLPELERAHLIRFARALDYDCAQIMLNPQSGLSQQTVRLFGVRAPGLQADVPLVDAGDFLALSRAGERPSSTLEGSFDLLAKLLIYDYIAKTTFSSAPPPPSNPMIWTGTLAGSKTAEFYLSVTDGWVEKLGHVLDIFKASPDGQRLRAREEEEEDTDNLDAGQYWDSERLPKATQRLVVLSQRNREEVLSSIEHNVILLGHIVDFLTTPSPVTKSLPLLKHFRDAMRSQANTPETKRFTERYFQDGVSGAMLSVQPLLGALCISPLLLVIGGQLDRPRPKAWNGFEMYAIFQRARASLRSQAVWDIENTIWNAAVDVGVRGVDSTKATMQALSDCCDYASLLEPSDAYVFSGVCSRAHVSEAKNVPEPPLREEEEEEGDDERYPSMTSKPSGFANPSAPSMDTPGASGPTIDPNVFLSTIINLASLANDAGLSDDSSNSSSSETEYRPIDMAVPPAVNLQGNLGEHTGEHRPPSLAGAASSPDAETDVPPGVVTQKTRPSVAQTPSSAEKNIAARSQLSIVPNLVLQPQVVDGSTSRPRVSTANPHKERHRQRTTRNSAEAISPPRTHHRAGASRTPDPHLRATSRRSRVGEEADMISDSESVRDDRLTHHHKEAATRNASRDSIGHHLPASTRSRVDEKIKAEDIEQHWLDTDDESDEGEVLDVEDLPESATNPLRLTTSIRALDNGPDPIEVQVPVPTLESEVHMSLYQAYRTGFQALLNEHPGDAPSFIKIYDSAMSWSTSWTTDSRSMLEALERRSVFLIKGSSDGGRGILQQTWNWDRETLNRIMPGIRHIKVQDTELAGAGTMTAGHRIVTLDQFITAGEKGHVLGILKPPPLSESPETLPHSRIFASHRQSLAAREWRLRELSGSFVVEPENDNDRNLYNRINNALTWTAILHRGTTVCRHIDAGGAGNTLICTRGRILYTIFDPLHHVDDSASDIRSVHFAHDFDAKKVSSPKACASMLLKGGDALVLPAMTICTFVALEDTIVVGERFFWHGNLPDSFCAYVMSMLDPRLAGSKRLETLSIIQSFGSAWGAIHTDESPVTQDPSYPSLEGADADAQLLKLFVVISVVVFDRSLSLGQSRPLLGSRTLDQLYLRETWLHKTRNGYIVAGGALPADSVKGLSDILGDTIGDRCRTRRLHFCGLAACLVYVGQSLLQVAEAVSQRVGAGKVVKSPEAMLKDVVADLREALYWPDSAVEHMLDQAKRAHTGSILPEMTWMREAPSESELRSKPLLWRETGGNTTQSTDKASRSRKLSATSASGDGARKIKRARLSTAESA
ncbi:hypothetical protein PENSPDRAFT_693601 [Peniophora sp. CONT]|nr:hypothetical protein PENSPDRAFT_693601 [Peniophora sp. CONT]